jgi:putative ABC transport system ATP-binding protein
MQATETQTGPLFQLRGLRKTYRMGEEVVNALDGLDLDIMGGEYLAILGASGCGKSTLMHILGFMDTATSGDFIFEGRNVRGVGTSQRAALRSEKIGFIFQSFNLLPQLTVMQNVLLPLSYARHGRRDGEKRAQKALDRVGLGHRLRHRPSQLSGGERQRVAIARALVVEPRLILADEPTGNLDSRNRQNILNLFSELHAEGNTLALVTHDPEVAACAHRIIRMKDGQIVEEETKGGGTHV